MKRKVTWIGEDWGFFIVRDYTEYVKDLKITNHLTEEQVDNFFRAGEFLPKEVQENNGSHFLYGEDESIGQSDHCPPQLYEKEVLLYKVEVVQ